jgi:hypothetical protein
MAEAYADLAALPEDQRIRIIGDTVMKTRKTSAVVTDDEPGKAERYAQKLRDWFPGIVVSAALPGPTRGAVTMRVSPPMIHYPPPGPVTT